MRVITGLARGRRLRELPGLDTRPTTDRVKEGLFSAIQFDIAGARVLDLFAGTGQLGIECLSRGAAEAVFVDSSPKAAALVRENLRATVPAARAVVRQADALDFLAHVPGRFDLIFLDPPYLSGLLEEAINRVAAFDILKPRGIIVAESPATAPFPTPPDPLRVGRTYRYGKIAVTLCRRIDAESAEIAQTSATTTHGVPDAAQTHAARPQSVGDAGRTDAARPQSVGDAAQMDGARPQNVGDAAQTDGIAGQTSGNEVESP